MTEIGPWRAKVRNMVPTSSPQQKVKTGGHLIRHARCYCYCWRRAVSRDTCLEHAAQNGGFAAAGRIDAAVRQNHLDDGGELRKDT